MMGAGPDYWTLETETGKHTKVYAKEPTAISMISDAFDGIVIYTLPEYGVSSKRLHCAKTSPTYSLGRRASLTGSSYSPSRKATSDSPPLRSLMRAIPQTQSPQKVLAISSYSRSS